MRDPNFFLIGAPKSGTTSMANYLSRHPNVFFTSPKEPQYFAQDFANKGAIKDRQAYMALFKDASVQHQVVGEGSTKYLRSNTAISLIERDFPKSRFLVMLRNPLEMARSLHDQVLFNGDESEADFVTAWRLQSLRRQGQSIPSGCEEPLDLQYGYFCRVGEQLEALLKQVDRSRVQVLLFEDFKSDVSGTYKSVLDFLDLPPHSLDYFPVVNVAKRTKFGSVKAIMRRLAKLKRQLGINRNFGVARKIHEINSRPIQRDLLPESFLDEFQAYFSDDIEKLSGILDRDLSHWRGR